MRLAAFSVLALCAFATQATAQNGKPTPPTPSKFPTSKANPQGGWAPIAPPTGSLFGGNDDCAAADPLMGQGMFSYDNTTATTGIEGQNEFLCDAFGTTAIQNDVWYEWTADATGIATISTCGSVFDTKIAAYPAGGCPVDGTAIACNDDDCGLQSTIRFDVVSGTNYLLQCGSFSDTASGVAVLDILISPPPANDDCSSPSMLMGQGIFSYDSTAASTGAEGQNETLCDSFGFTGIDADVWIEWTADASGRAVIATCGTVFDTKLAAYPAGGCPADGTAIACNDDDCGLQSSLEFMCTSGTTYLLQCGAFPGALPGLATLEIDIVPPPLAIITANECSAPDVIMGQGFYEYDNNLANTGAEGQFESLCDAFGTTNVNNDVWAAWTADATGTVFISTCGSSIDTKIAAYPGNTCPMDGTAIVCNDDSCGLQSDISFDVTAGDTYLLQLGTFSDAAFGVADLRIDIDGSGVGNNYCTAAGNSVSPSGSIMSAAGNPSLSAMDMTLFASNAPLQPGLFFFGPSQLQIPFGEGFRCVGGQVVRLPVVTPTNGSFQYNIDFAMFGGSLAPGEVNFQCWYRDPAAGGSNFNLSDGYSITFVP